MDQRQYEAYLRRLIDLVYLELVVKIAMLDYFSVRVFAFPSDLRMSSP